MSNQAHGFERRSEATKGLIGASIGFALFGPIGAGIGGYLGARMGSAEDEYRLYCETHEDSE